MPQGMGVGMVECGGGGGGGGGTRSSGELRAPGVSTQAVLVGTCGYVKCHFTRMSPSSQVPQYSLSQTCRPTMPTSQAWPWLGGSPDSVSLPLYLVTSGLRASQGMLSL